MSELRSEARLFAGGDQKPRQCQAAGERTRRHSRGRLKAAEGGRGGKGKVCKAAGRFKTSSMPRHSFHFICKQFHSQAPDAGLHTALRIFSLESRVSLVAVSCMLERAGLPAALEGLLLDHAKYLINCELIHTSIVLNTLHK